MRQKPENASAKRCSCCDPTSVPAACAAGIFGVQTDRKQADRKHCIQVDKWHILRYTVSALKIIVEELREE